jgi:lipopolysaccharide/colanic/teichoic acid biosynthesis glycosyltransferase
LPPREGSRRALNIAVAAAGLVLAAPILAGIAVLIKLTSPGPILYQQTRIGLDRRATGDADLNHRRKVNYGGRPFTIYKFRTMNWQPAAAEAQVWATPDDPRVTRLGRILRQYRLDELPQLFNVLRGDMNIVGPRPEQPNIVLQLREQIQNYEHRHLVRPGITGWAQVNYNYDTSVDDVRRKVAYDLQYVARQSLIEDVRIMLRTAPVILWRRGAW